MIIRGHFVATGDISIEVNENESYKLSFVNGNKQLSELDDIIQWGAEDLVRKNIAKAKVGTTLEGLREE